MRPTTFLIIILAALLLATTQFATADYRLTNGSATEEVWIVYSTWQGANNGWPEGWRTDGWYKIQPGATLNLQVPHQKSWVYILAVNRNGVEIKPADHAARYNAPFWIHPSQAFTVVETSDGHFLKSDRAKWNLVRANLYEYRNGGSHTVTSSNRGRQNAPNPTTQQNQQIYDQAMQSVVWVLNTQGDSQGSGFLIDAEKQFVVTNHHVIDGASSVIVCFPAPDENGDLIGDRNYYTANYLKLGQKGYATAARVIAEDSIRDLAVLQLDFLPKNSQEIDHNFNTDLSRNMRRNDIVHLMGNPGSTDLWDWRIGSFQKDDGNWVHIDVQAYDGRGSSGGPVLNAKGTLIGIITKGDERGNVWAVPARDVEGLLDTVGPKWTFRIENVTNGTIAYEIRWSQWDDWTSNSLKSKRADYHWWNKKVVPKGYPKIRFDSSDGGWNTDTVYRLDTFRRYFGANYEDHVTIKDAYTYYFYYNTNIREIDLSFWHNGCVPRDINNDGATNLQDLDFVASRIGTASTGKADVDWDGDVDIEDLIFVAGLNCFAAGAPSVHLETLPNLTVENLQTWINQAKQLEVITPQHKKGIQALEQLLATLSHAQSTSIVLPKETQLLSNYPNPFNPETWIPYQLSKPAAVRVTIYGTDGRLVRTLALGHQPAGVYQSKSRAVYWDGKNEIGEPVASGVYFYTLTAGEFTATRKMLIRK